MRVVLALLALLAVCAAAPEQAEIDAAALWARSLADAAAQDLPEAAHVLRRALEGEPAERGVRHLALTVEVGRNAAMRYVRRPQSPHPASHPTPAPAASSTSRKGSTRP